MENYVNAIYNDLDRYWKYTADFLKAIELYLTDLNTKYKLGLDPDEIFSLSSFLATNLLMEDLSQHNTLYIIAQYISYVFFQGQHPQLIQLDKQKVFSNAESIRKNLIVADLKVNPNIRLKLDSNQYVLKKELQNENNFGEQVIVFILTEIVCGFFGFLLNGKDGIAFMLAIGIGISLAAAKSFKISSK